MVDLRDITINGLLGLATADALGTPCEFMTREQVRALNLRDMVGCDTPTRPDSRWAHMVPAGAWSDDTSLTVATMAAIIEDGGDIRYDNIMAHFLRWWDNGEYTPCGRAFGLGGTTSKALGRFRQGFQATSCGCGTFEDNGNGSLMRIFPFALWCIAHRLTLSEIVDLIDDASSITHAHQISRMGCVIFTIFLRGIIETCSAANAWELARMVDYSQFYGDKALDAYAKLLSDDGFTEDDIGETGYVVDTLMTAVYSMLHSHDYESAVLTAINMGFDTDTAGAVTGALAGVLYGRGNIPRRWRVKLLQGDFLACTALSFADAITPEK